MPILIEKERKFVVNKWVSVPIVVFNGPDRTERYCYSLESEFPPPSLDPLLKDELKGWLIKPQGEEHAIHIDIELDYSHTGPERVEQILFIRGLNNFRQKVYLSSEGNGATVGSKPKPQDEPHKLEVLGLAPIRPAGVYRRERVYNRNGENGKSKEVVGWIAISEHDRKKGYERR